MSDLGLDLSSLTNYQDASISTVAPNPTVQNSNSGVNDFTSIANTVGQWGATIADIVSQPKVVYASGTGYASAPPSSSNTLLLLAVVGVVVWLVIK